ncbi:hypothetical protein [Noviherbaspirillum massiliense]|uniref:hypothetical protein n=1 Tax=Noviherbaspirillum massiliense TaxID=1465823 RepID=UPI0011DCC880|nr:hypothetical protein [Noviherbaspirillum massiliense]
MTKAAVTPLAFVLIDAGQATVSPPILFPATALPCQSTGPACRTVARNKYFCFSRGESIESAGPAEIQFRLLRKIVQNFSDRPMQQEDQQVFRKKDATEVSTQG